MKKYVLKSALFVVVAMFLFSCTKEKNNENTGENEIICDVEGGLKGLFSVSDSTRVFFSKGNLQWSAEGVHAVADGGTAAGTWRFAEKQGDYVGNKNDYISSSYTGWIDLFGWGTSGWDNGNLFYQPYNSSDSMVAPYTRDVNYGYGPFANSFVGQSANSDWGVYNAISNGGNMPGLWRTLSSSEWDYLLNTRITASGMRYVVATVNGVQGLIILPDNWSVSKYTFDNPNSHIISENDWMVLENAGCAFLPNSGMRAGTRTLDYEGNRSIGRYWTSTNHMDGGAVNILILGSVDAGDYVRCCYGSSVRLVHDFQ